MNDRGRLALCPSRFGPGVVGGAEIVLAEMAHGLKARGWEVEILTTTAVDHFSWANTQPEGTSVEEGLVVRRFAATPPLDEVRYALEPAILDGRRLAVADQERWINSWSRTPGLYHHLLGHADEYRAIFFTPYLSWLAYAASQLRPERTVLWTCLHDEPHAYLDLFAPMLGGVAGLLLQSDPEHDLLHRVATRPAPHGLVGCGVPVPAGYDPERFRARYGIDGPFLLYAGRREGAKGWEDLLRSFATATLSRNLPFSLVTIGSGPVDPPAEIAGRVVDLGFLPDQDRDDAYAAASAYLQPSRYEAFSRTIMEAWLAGTPVIANGASDVVRWHCEQSGAGVVYEDDLEFEECLTFVAEAPDSAAQLAAPGAEYVRDHYTWSAVLDRIEVCLDKWTSP